MYNTDFLTQLQKMRNQIAYDFSVITQTIISLGGEPHEIKLESLSQKQGRAMKILQPEEANYQPREVVAVEEEKVSLPAPKPYVPYIPKPACYPPESGITQYSLWKDKILFALR